MNSGGMRLQYLIASEMKTSDNFPHMRLAVTAQLRRKRPERRSTANDVQCCLIQRGMTRTALDTRPAVFFID